jgi:hypothetical protein
VCLLILRQILEGRARYHPDTERSKLREKLVLFFIFYFIIIAQKKYSDIELLLSTQDETQRLKLLVFILLPLLQPTFPQNNVGRRARRVTLITSHDFVRFLRYELKKLELYSQTFVTQMMQACEEELERLSPSCIAGCRCCRAEPAVRLVTNRLPMSPLPVLAVPVQAHRLCCIPDRSMPRSMPELLLLELKKLHALQAASAANFTRPVRPKFSRAVVRPPIRPLHALQKGVKPDMFDPRLPTRLFIFKTPEMEELEIEHNPIEPSAEEPSQSFLDVLIFPQKPLYWTNDSLVDVCQEQAIMDQAPNWNVWNFSDPVG